MKLQCILPSTYLTVGKIYEGQLLRAAPNSVSSPYSPFRFVCYNDRGKWESYNPHVFRPAPESVGEQLKKAGVL